MTDSYAESARTVLWSDKLSRSFSLVDGDGDGFVTRGEMQNCLQDEACRLLVGEPAAQTFAKNYDDIQFASSFGTSFQRGLMGKEGIAQSDLAELSRRARELPEAMESAKKIESVLAKVL